MAPPYERSTTAHARAGESRAWVLAPAAVLAAQALVLLAAGQPAGSWANDQSAYHLVAIHTFARELPTPDLVNYASATSPGWHLLLAALTAAGASTMMLRIVSVCAGVTLLLAATATAARWVSPRTAAFLLLPLAVSPYAVGGSSWITTDVPALACIALSLAAITRGLGTRGAGNAASAGPLRPGSTPWNPWAAAAWATIGVAIRQPLAWLAAPLAWRAWRERRPAGVIAALLPVALLAVLVVTWQGLIPPAYRSLHQRGINPAGLIVLLALTATWGGPVALVLAVADEHRRKLARAAIIGAAVALFAALCIATSFAKGEGGVEGRWGGPLWGAVEITPAFGDRSVLLTVLATLGGATIAVLSRLAFMRGTSQAATIILLALACIAATNVANSQAWQRYADLPLLLLLPWCAALAIRTPRAARAACMAAVAVALAQAAIASVNLWKPAFANADEPASTVAPHAAPASGPDNTP